MKYNDYQSKQNWSNLGYILSLWHDRLSSNRSGNSGLHSLILSPAPARLWYWQWPVRVSGTDIDPGCPRVSGVTSEAWRGRCQLSSQCCASSCPRVPGDLMDQHNILSPAHSLVTTGPQCEQATVPTWISHRDTEPRQQTWADCSARAGARGLMTRSGDRRASSRTGCSRGTPTPGAESPHTTSWTSNRWIMNMAFVLHAFVQILKQWTSIERVKE